jgi:hypothetical protein
MQYPQNSCRPLPLLRHWLVSSHRQTSSYPLGIPCRTAHKNGIQAIPSLLYAMPSEAFELFPELLGSHQSPVPHFFQHPLELRPLPSTGITRLLWYYEPFRRPNRPSLPSRDSGWISSINLGFPCCARSPFIHAVATTPTEALTLLARPRPHLRPSLLLSQVGFRITLFEACSAFTHVTACMIAESPVSDPFHQRLQRLHCFHRCSDCFRLERQLPGGFCTH